MTISENIFKRLTTKSALLDAWRVIQKKRKAGGIDRVTVGFFEKDFDRNIDTLLYSLQNDSYVPEPYERINIKKDNKPDEYRPLSLPIINDKIVQQALKQELEPLFNPVFLDVSYAYRYGKGPAKAIARIFHIVTTNNINWAVCADIDQFFDAIDHKILLAELQKKVNKPQINKLVQMWLKIGVVNPKGMYEETSFGVAQGGIISPLFSNIYLHPFDVYMTEKGCHYVRYADNFILMAENKRKIEKDFKAATYFLNEVLKLRLNKQKYWFNHLDLGFVFMGIFFKKKQKFIDRSRLKRMESRLRFIVQSKLHSNPKHFYKKMEETRS